MHFPPDKPVVKLCIEGSSKELQDDQKAAADLYQNAWDQAGNDLERFIAAHYVARIQPSVEMKLKWDEAALEFALKTNDEFAIESMPSLYINIAKGFNDKGDFEKAKLFYRKALASTEQLRDRGVAKMVESVILKHIVS